MGLEPITFGITARGFALSYAHHWSEVWESNPPDLLGRQLYHQNFLPRLVEKEGVEPPRSSRSPGYSRVPFLLGVPSVHF